MAEQDAERNAIEASLRGEGWAAHTSLEREIDTWANLASDVASYRMTIDDYTNDLCSRDYLETFLSRATPQLRRFIETAVAQADERFRESSVEDAEGLVGRYYRIDDGDGWWWRRRPPTGPLADYLAEHA